MSNLTLDDIDATPDEKRSSRIAADVWGVDPVRFDDDGDPRPLLSEVWIRNEDKRIEGRLEKFGVVGITSTLPDVSLEEGPWMPVHVSDGIPVMRGGTYRHIEAVGLVYEDCGNEYGDLATVLLKTLDFERNGTPKERPCRLGAGPAIDLESWRSEFTNF